METTDDIFFFFSFLVLVQPSVAKGDSILVCVHPDVSLGCCFMRHS